MSQGTSIVKSDVRCAGKSEMEANIQQLEIAKAKLEKEVRMIGAKEQEGFIVCCVGE